MNTLAEIHARLLEQLKTLSRIQVSDPYTAYYLYCRPSTDERDGDVLVASDSPGPEWRLWWPQRLRPIAPEDNLKILFQQGITKGLPVLSTKKVPNE